MFFYIICNIMWAAPSSHSDITRTKPLSIAWRTLSLSSSQSDRWYIINYHRGNMYVISMLSICPHHLPELVESPLLSVVVSVAKHHLANSIICPINRPSRIWKIEVQFVLFWQFSILFSLLCSGIIVCTSYLGLTAKVVCDGVNRVDTWTISPPKLCLSITCLHFDLWYVLSCVSLWIFVTKNVPGIFVTFVMLEYYLPKMCLA